MRLAFLGSLAAATLVGGSTSGAVMAAPAQTISTSSSASVAAAACAEAPGADLARVRDGSTVQEPALYPDNEAKAYGVLPDSPRLTDGSVVVETVFHSISDHELTAAERDRAEQMIRDQMDVLNDSFSGATAPDASDTPFRFQLKDIDFVVNKEWYGVVPGKGERDMKQALYTGDSRTLNVYSADIGANLLGWAYFPKDYNSGRDFIDGVVILDESMPGGTAGKYALGDTLTHEVGHWLMLHHTFNNGCSASGDHVADTPKEAFPQFDCPVGADSCAAPGLDPIHNFMDYSQDSCMDMFTAGQAERMSDAWLAFRAGGQG